MATSVGEWAQEARSLLHLAPEDEQAGDEEPTEYPDAPATTAAMTPSYANWVLRKLAEEEKAIFSINEQLHEEQARLTAHASEIAQAHQRRIDWLTAQYEPALREYAKQRLKGKKDRSIKLLYGVVGFRKGRASVEVIDEDLALEWLRVELTEGIRIKESVDKEIVKRRVEETGELVPGTEYRPAEDAFYIKPEVSQ